MRASQQPVKIEESIRLLCSLAVPFEMAWASGARLCLKPWASARLHLTPPPAQHTIERRMPLLRVPVVVDHKRVNIAQRLNCLGVPEEQPAATRHSRPLSERRGKAEQHGQAMISTETLN